MPTPHQPTALISTPFVRSILDAALDAAIAMDADGRIIEWNREAECVFGWLRSEVLGQRLESLIVPPAYRDDYCRGMEGFRSTGTGPVLVGTQTLTALKRSGEEFPMKLSTTVVTDSGTTIVIGFIRELTRQIATEQKLARQTLESDLLRRATTLPTDSESFDKALLACVDMLCKVTGWPVGHVYVVDDSRGVLESSGVWHLDNPTEFDEFRKVTEATSIAMGQGFVGRIWESGEAGWTSDIAQENFVRGSLRHDLNVHAAFGFPVKIDNEIVAVMEFYTSNEITPDPQLLRMVHSIGGQLGRIIERRRLQEEQVRQAAIVNSSSDAIISRTLTGTITSWNDGAHAIFGYTAEQAIEGGFDLILPASVRDDDARIIEALQSGKHVRQFETLRKCKDGTEVCVSVTVSPITDANGNIVGASTIERDITELIETRIELQESEQHARLLLESTAEAIYGIDLSGICTFCNPSCVKMLGYGSPSELLGRNMHEMMHHTRPDGSPYPITECRIYTAFRVQKGSHVNDELLWRKDGTGFPAEYWSHPILRDGKAVGAVVTFLDITDRKAAEEEQARLASVVGSSVDAIIATDPDGTIIQWNRGAELVYGYSEAETIGKDLSFILPPGLRPEDSVVLNAIRHGQELTQFATVRQRKDNELINVSITVSPIRTADGRLVGASSIERDTTARYHREQELEQARETAEAANQAKSEFLANISHELRTPMNSIIGMTDLALREELPGDVRDCLVTAKDSADTLLFLLNDILDFSRMEAGRFELEPVDFNLRGMMHDTIKSLSLRAHEKGLELACQIDSDVPYWLRGDSLRLRQIITNLVTNALKFTDQGEVVVKISLERPSQELLQVGDSFGLHIAVTDTGIGISDQDRRRIFSPFTQADASTTRRYSGTGLGLSICRKLTALMEGRMWVKSELGKGSTFHCTARLAVAEDGDDEVYRERVTVKQLKSMPVLIVDDNLTNRKILVEMLRNWSLCPVACSDADEAFAELVAAADRGEAYPLVIVDALMPRVDGFMLIERMHADPRVRRAIILMLSSADRHVFKERCSSLPVSSYLEKPVSQSDLLDAIMAALEGPQFVSRANAALGLTDRPLRILVAEDTPANQKVITRILEKRGHNVEIAHNGREAVDRTQRERFDIVIMDVQMPTMDGLQATAAIRKQERTTGQHLPILAMTAHAMRGDREKCLEAGMDDYLSKPINTDKLIRLLESIVAGEAGESDRADPDDPPAALPDRTPGTALDDAQDEIPVWNAVAALQRLGDDTDLLQDMIGYFLEDSPKLIAAIESSIVSGEHDELARAAHSLKGLCSNFEGRRATHAAQQMQDVAKSEDMSDATPRLAALKSEIASLHQHLALWQVEQSSEAGR